MAMIKLSRFGGIVPALNDTALPENNAARAVNAFLYSGAIQGFHEFKQLHALPSSSYASTFRLPNRFLDATHLGDAKWVDFVEPFVDVVRTAVVGDTYERFYWATPSSPPRYNTRARMEAGNTGANAPFLLGVPAPAYTPTLSAGTGTGTTVTRSYVVTWVTAYGEEGPPCTPISAAGPSDATWTVGGLVPPNFTDRNITRLRVYRTITGSQGIATYFLVADLPVSTTTYADAMTDTVASASQQLQSLTWFPPPTDLQGWVSMPNGIVAGWRGKEIWFSEPFRPHAWPSQYALTTEYNIVGLGVYGQTLVVCTEGFPTAITGINPASMTMAKISTFEPCMSRGSIVSAPEGVYYASPNGLIRAAQGQFVNVTRDAITKDKWQSLLNIATLRAAHLGSGYIAFGTARSGVFNTTAFQPTMVSAEDYTGAYTGLFIDPSNPSSWTTMENALPVANIQTDPWSGEVFFVFNGGVYWFDMQTMNRKAEPFVWRSKKFHSNKVQNFEAAKVYFQIPTGVTFTPAGTVDNSLHQVLEADQYGLLRVFADDRLIATRELRKSGEMLRLPSGFKAEYWQIEFEARVNITEIQMATSAKELANG